MRFLYGCFYTAFYLKLLLLSIPNSTIQSVLALSLVLFGLAIFILRSVNTRKYVLPKFMSTFCLWLFFLVISLFNVFLIDGVLLSGISDLMKFITMFFVLYVFYTDDKFFNTNRFLITYVVLIHMAVAIVGYPLGLGKEYGGVYRPFGIAGTVNVLANLALFSSVYFGVRALAVKKFNIDFLVSSLSFFVVFLSGTLKNVLVMLMLPVLYTFLESKNKVRSLLLVCIVFIPLAYLAIASTSIYDRFIEVFSSGIDLNATAGDNLGSSAGWRVFHWKLLLEDWWNNYRLNGSGIGQVVHMNALKTVDGNGFDAHSDWIGFFVELGPLIFLSFIFFNFYYLNYIKAQKLLDISVKNALYFSFLSLILSMSFGPVVYSVAYFYIFWAVLGLETRRSR